MLKSAIVLIIVTAVAVIFRTEVVFALHYLLILNDKLIHGLGAIFSSGPVGRVILDTVTLVVIPAAIAGVLALGWYLVRRQQMPHLLATVWVIWTILFVAILSQPAAHHIA